MYKTVIEDFELEQIAASGQCFRMNKIDTNVYGIVAFHTFLQASQEGETITFSCDEEEFNVCWRSYFDLDRDYRVLKESVDKEDAFLQKAITCAGGIRILRQDLWEIMVTFIVSQRNNIPRIKKIIDLLCNKFGEKKHHQTGFYYTFPTPEKLAILELSDLSDCNLGYRDKYILKAAQSVIKGEIDLNFIRGLDYEAAKKELLKIYGVGIKVAECICLYGLHHIDAFPIDTHVQNILNLHYPEGFPFSRYMGYAGILQQYGFYYDLHGSMY